MKLLHLDSSILAGNSVSRQLTAALVDNVRRQHPSIEVSYRDLAGTAIAHLSGEIIGANFTPEADWNATQRSEKALTDELIAEFMAADVIVIGAPMYNFSIPSQLKAWIDRVAQAGRTFRYTSDGPQGLAVGKKVVVVSTRGGVYAGTAYEAAMDHQESYLRTVLNFLGMTDVTFVRAEGIAMKKDEAVATANRQIAELRVEYPRAA
jgi:FMN-dependent NADH-azoreductase